MESLIHTSCRNCIFNVSKANVQDGCFLNRIKKEDEMRHEDGHSFFRLKRYCKFCKDKDWMEKFNLDNLDSAKQFILEKNTILTDLIVLMGEHYTLSDLDMFLASLDTKYVGKVIVSVNNKSVRLKPLQDILNKYQIKWSSKTFLEHYDEDYQVNECYKATENWFYMVVTHMDEYDNSIPSKINERFNLKEEQFLMIEGNSYDKLVMHVALHKIVGGCYPERAIAYAKEQECPHLITKH